MAGQEMYSVLSQKKNVTIIIQSMAGSAASVVAMAGKSKISPVAMIMIHNVSICGASGDYHDMQKHAEILKQMNAAMAGSLYRKIRQGTGRDFKNDGQGNMADRKPMPGIWPGR